MNLIINLDKQQRFSGVARWVTDEELAKYRKINPAFDRYFCLLDVNKANEYPPEIFEGVNPNPIQSVKKSKKEESHNEKTV